MCKNENRIWIIAFVSTIDRILSDSAFKRSTDLRLEWNKKGTDNMATYGIQ